MTDDFENGELAYFDNRDELYFSGSPEFRRGFENAFVKNQGHKYDDGGDGVDQAFERYIDNIYRPAELSPEPSGTNAIGAMGKSLLGIVMAFIFAGLLMACFLFENAEIGGMR